MTEKFSRLFVALMKYFFDDNKLHIPAIHFCVIAFVPANFI
jgi:hypothetical protein